MLCRQASLARVARGLATVLLVGLAATTSLSATVAHKKQVARTQFDNAEKMREALNGRPQSQRKAKDYKRVEDAYRRVYYIAPTSVKADQSVVAVAELLAEEGRTFKNDVTLKSAIEQYEFLRREYPGSKSRVQALFTIAQIYRDDLNDKDNAKATLQEFVKRYPHSQQFEEARQALKELDEPPVQEAKKRKTKPEAKIPDTKPLPSKKVVEPDDPETAAAQEDQTAAAKEPLKQVAEAAPEPAEHRNSKILVTGIRHWSTPDYTRIAIDLEDEVRYESGRIPRPDRIYFDLKDTRLSSVLKGKIFDVDDGFLKRLRIAQFIPGQTRVVLEVGDDVSEYSAFLLPNPYRLVIDIHGKRPAKLLARTQVSNSGDPDAVKASQSPVEKPAVTGPSKDVTVVKTETTMAKVTVPAKPDAKTKVEDDIAPDTVTPEPAKIEAAKNEVKKTDSRKPASEVSRGKKKGVVSITDGEGEGESDSTSTKPAPAKSESTKSARGKKRADRTSASIREAQPTTNGDRSLIRALGLKIGRIVVDAGHGGHDTGTIGPNGLREKDLVLDVALRLGKLLEDRLGADVVYTRDDDTFIPLETRTAVANQQQADLFISIHANSSHDASARGIETYYLNFTSSRDALEVAARENAVSEKSIHELQDLVKKIALKDKIEESHEFALDIQQSLHSGLTNKAPAIRDRGVKKAPFIVLIGANMPSILAEISFISNPMDEKKLQTPEYRQKIADSLCKGVEKYVGGLSGIKVAAKMAKEDGD